MLPLHLIKNRTNIEFTAHKKCAYAFSTIITLSTIILFLLQGINLGIDFTGGILLEITSKPTIPPDTIRDVLTKSNLHSITVQNDDQGSLILRASSQNKTPDNRTLESNEIKQLKQLIENSTSLRSYDLTFRRADYVGPKVGISLIVKGIIAIILALLAMMIYVTMRFDWKFGVGVLIALVHDIVVTIGFFVITRYEFDITSIAALLTIIGYSVNDSVVIYDRVRENIRKYKNKLLPELINISINETLSRTIMTVATTLIVCVALVLFGGPALKSFSSVLLFGIAFGTYSSIYISALTLLFLQKRNT